jgi:hypothetical protein
VEELGLLRRLRPTRFPPAAGSSHIRKEVEHKTVCGGRERNGSSGSEHAANDTAVSTRAQRQAESKRMRLPTSLFSSDTGILFAKIVRQVEAV